VKSLLKELSVSDGYEIYEMLKEIGPGENGYENDGYALEFADFTAYLKGHSDASEGIGLKPEWVPQTVYWLFIDDRPVGVGKLRHSLTERLRKRGGHIGYCIRPSERGKGYGEIILGELLLKAREKNISEVILTCNEDNAFSRRVIEANEGVLSEILDGRCYYLVCQRTVRNH